MSISLIHGDCLEAMADMPDSSIDMVMCDLPYGVTQNKWDVLVPLDQLWRSYKRIVKKDGAIVLTSMQPFTSILIMSNLEMFRYEWIWAKNKATGHLNAKKRPMVAHENVLVFFAKISFV